MCTKTAFFTKADAEWALRQPQRSLRPREHKVPVRAYECAKCRCWHLTSQPEQRSA